MRVFEFSAVNLLAKYAAINGIIREIYLPGLHDG
jgi:hypothetical protein